MGSKPDISSATNDGMNKHMGRTAAPVHRMSFQEAKQHYIDWNKQKAEEAKELAETAKQDAKKMGIISTVIGIGATLLGASTGVALLAAAPTLLMGAHKADQWINKLEEKDSHEVRARSHSQMRLPITQFAKEQNIEIDDNLTRKEDKKESLRRSTVFKPPRR